MEYLKIANWDTWQTYRSDRNQPPWIKVYRRLLRNPEWVSLTDAQRGQLVAIWLLAADHEGSIPNSELVVQQLCYMKKKPNLQLFVDLGFIEIGVALASSGSQADDSVTPQTRLDKTRLDKTRLPPTGGLNGFSDFWKVYPRKVKKEAALKAWKKISPSDELREVIEASVLAHRQTHEWLKDYGTYVPYPATWLNDKRWEDEFGSAANVDEIGDALKKIEEEGDET